MVGAIVLTVLNVYPRGGRLWVEMAKVSIFSLARTNFTRTRATAKRPHRKHKNNNSFQTLEKEHS